MQEFKIKNSYQILQAPVVAAGEKKFKNSSLGEVAGLVGT